MLCATGASAAGGTSAIDIAVQQSDGSPLDGAAVTLRRLGATNPISGAAANTASASSMDQQNRAFTPEVLVVPVGGSVVFPNSDSVSHQVYSFSPAKRFQLPLYRGKVYPPTKFDTPGIVTLGCNIHDNMIGWILVTDAPWFGRTDAQGRWSIGGLAAGEYEITVWHPRLRDEAGQLTSRLRVESGASAQSRFRSAKPMRPGPLSGKSREWDY